MTNLMKSIQLLSSVLQEESIAFLMDKLAAFDANTWQHSIGVAQHSLCIGIQMQMSDEELKDLARGALLHDIGKLWIPKSILNKPGKLTEEERQQMQYHPEYGYLCLKQYPEFSDTVLDIVRYHHVQYNGSGYPAEHPQLSTSVHVVHTADIYDALTRERPYKGAMPSKEVKSMLIQNTTQQYYPAAAQYLYHM